MRFFDVRVKLNGDDCIILDSDCIDAGWCCRYHLTIINHLVIKNIH